MKYLIIFFAIFLINYSYGQKILILDSKTKEALPFASYYSSNGNCSGYSNLRGIIKFCPGIDTLKVSYLGYKTGIILNHSKITTDTLYLTKRSYNLDSIIIKSTKINLFKELNTILSIIREDEYSEEVNSLFYLESIESKEMIERVEMISNDNLSNKIIKQNSRVLGRYLIDKKKPYYSLDIDEFFKSISFFSKRSKSFKHIFNNRKIKRKYYNITLLRTDNDNIREVLYKKKDSEKIHGIIKYNYKNLEILEHRFRINDFNTSSYSLNKAINTSIDSIEIHYKFNHNHFVHLTFSIWIHKNSMYYSNRKIISRGFIKVLNNFLFKSKIELPEYKYESLQEEVIYTSQLNNKIISFDSISTIDSSFYKKKSPSEFLCIDNTMTLDFLNSFNVVNSKRKLWSLNKKLTKNDYISNDAIVKIGGRGKMTFLSDLQKTKIHWIIIPIVYKGKITYISPPSIWNSKESMVLYYNDNQSEWLANTIFSIFELYRRKLLMNLNNNSFKYPQIEISKYYSDASKVAKRILRETSYGVKNRNKTNRYIKEQFSK